MKGKKVKMYIPSCAISWLDVSAIIESTGIKAKEIKMGGEFGNYFIPVYKNKKECKKYHPKNDVLIIEV